MLSPEDVATFERCIAVGGVALFPADTVYGLATEPDSKEGIARLNALKARDPAKPSAVMFFSVELALAALPELGERTRGALERLLPGPYTLVLPNPAGRYPLATRPVPDRLGLRVPDVPALAEVKWPVLQSSADPAGGADARRLEDVDERIRRAVDLQLDGGELPERRPRWWTSATTSAPGQYRLLREGAVPAAEVQRQLG